MRILWLEWPGRRVLVEGLDGPRRFHHLACGVVGVQYAVPGEVRWAYFDVDSGNLLHEWGWDSRLRWGGLLEEYDAMERSHLAKAKARKAASNADSELEDAELARRYPAVLAFLASNVDEEGKARERSKVTIFAEGGKLKASLVDVWGEQSLFVTIGKPEDAFKALEKALEVEEPDWRPWRTRSKEAERKVTLRGKRV